MRKLFLFLISTFLLTSVNAQSIFEVKKGDNKFIYGQSIKLFIGNILFVEANVDGQSIKEFNIVKTISDSSRTMIIEFKYDKFGDHKASILKISNPFKDFLHYKAMIKPIKGDNYVETSIVPVFPGIFSMEMWPYKIESIILSDFEIKKE